MGDSSVVLWSAQSKEIISTHSVCFFQLSSITVWETKM